MDKKIRIDGATYDDNLIDMIHFDYYDMGKAEVYLKLCENRIKPYKMAMALIPNI